MLHKGRQNIQIGIQKKKNIDYGMFKNKKSTLRYANLIKVPELTELKTKTMLQVTWKISNRIDMTCI